MSYADASALSGRLGATDYAEIYPSSGAGPAADLASASAEIDGAVGVRYALPVTGEGSLALLSDWCLTLASERAWSRGAGSELPVKIKDAAAQVRKYLEMVREGGFRLPDAVERPGGSLAFQRVSDPVFGRDNMDGF